MTPLEPAFFLFNVVCLRKRSGCKGATCIELAFFLFNIVCALLLGCYLWTRSGALYGIIGAVLGFGLAVGFWQFILLLDHLWHKWRPLRPSCRRGACRAEDYHWLVETEQGDVFRCCCGDKYLRRGTKFMELLPDGSTRSYMKRGRLAKWVPDTE